jgi:hypothetical protein
MAQRRHLLTGVLLAFVLGGGAESSQPEIPAIKVVYFLPDSAVVEAPERFSSALAAVAEQAKAFDSKLVLVVPEGAMEATSTARKQLLDARTNIVVGTLIANGVPRETISEQPKFGEGAELYDGDPARSAELNGVNVLVVPSPVFYGDGYRPSSGPPPSPPTPSKLPEVHLDDH